MGRSVSVSQVIAAPPGVALRHGDDSYMSRQPELSPPEQPRLTAFWVVTPEPLPFVHGTTYSFWQEDQVEGLAGIHMAPVAHVEPVENAAGRNVVSIKFWQVRTNPAADAEAMDAVLKVFQSVFPSNMAPPLRKPEESGDGEQVITVVEMVTVPIPERDPLDLCLNRLIALVRATRAAERGSYPELTAERLWPMVFWAERALSAHGGWLAGPSCFPLHPNLRTSFSPEPVTDDRLAKINVTLTRLLQGDTFHLYVERTIDRDHAMRWGDYGGAVLHQAIAVEILVRGVASRLLWERGDAAAGGAKKVLAAQPGRLMTRLLATELEGDWDPDGAGPVGEWRQRIAQLRNRVVHQGHRPTREEAIQAQAAGYALDTHIRDRLIANLNKYPRTACLLLGKPGLERYGVYDQVRSLIDDHDEPNWITSHAAWLAKTETHDEPAERARPAEPQGP